MRKMRKVAALLLSAVMCVSCFAGCGKGGGSETKAPAETKGAAKETEKAEGTKAQGESQSSAAGFDGTIKMGAVLPLTGASAETGIGVQQGLELAAAEINEAGGIKMNGKSYEVELYFEDDQGAADQSVSAAEKLLTMDGVSILYSECLSSCALAIMDICNQYPDTLFTTVECTSDNFSKLISEDPDRYFNFFKPCFNSADYGSNFGEMIADLSKEGIIDFENKKVAYIVEDTDAGRSCVDACEAALEEFCGGSETVAIEVVPQGSTDFYSQINKIKSLEPDVVMTYFVPLNSGVAYCKQVYELGRDWTDVGFVYPMKAGFVEQAGAACEGLIWFPQMADFEHDEKCAQFGEKVLNMFPKAGLTAIHLSAYNIMYMVKEALETSGTTSAKDGLAEAYFNVDYQAINGRYVFKEDHTSKSSAEYLPVTCAQVQNQEYYVIWPSEYATAEPVSQQ
ncbi:MAG: amino acid ABC transporter substrate-binding protein [Lachnospiraceae bacterium]|nr:amino acid ABC transporter substrate-binding protein [Lachnospiraceae bacterium]